MTPLGLKSGGTRPGPVAYPGGYATDFSACLQMRPVMSEQYYQRD